MGVVYEAEDLSLSRHVALKFLPGELASNPDALQRFEREAQVASKLNHPNSIAILDFGTTAAGASFIVMEYLKGVSLSTVLEHEEVGVGRAIRTALSPDGVFVAQTNGVAAGQTVFHYHLHLIPRWHAGEPRIHGRQRARPDELEAVAAQIRDALRGV